MARRAPAAPRVATGKVVNGKIVTRAKFPEGTKLLLEAQIPDEELDLELDEEDIAAIDRALESIRQGKGIPGDVVRAKLRRL
jgi:hypothetical protein